MINIPKVSVVIPVYNARLYIDSCVKSVLNQTFKDFEIILIDDGSTDGSGERCDQLAHLHSNILVYHQENQGVTHARKVGVSIATGEWITFVDADDELKEEALSLLVDTSSDKCDIVLGFCEPTNIACHRYDAVEYRHMCLRGKVPASPCAKLYRRTIFNDWIFDIPREIRIGEDLLMNIRYAFCAQKGVRVLPDNEVIYYYIDNPYQTTKNIGFDSHVEDLFYHHWQNSIPNHMKSEYFASMCISRIRFMCSLAKRDYKIPITDLQYYKSLLIDIKKIHLPFKYYVIILLMSSTLGRYLYNLLLRMLY